MSTKKIYNILWIDDEHQGLSGFKGEARSNGLILHPFKSLNGGISELKKNYAAYDAVLLDAKFLENEDDIAGTEDTDNVHRAKEELGQLDKKFNIFVLTGQAEAYDDKTFNKAFKKVYRKGKDEDLERLFIDLKASADQQEDTQIRHKYNRVFEVCTDKYIGKRAGEDLLGLLKIDDNAIDTDKYLAALRKIIEDIFIAFNQQELLPDVFVHSGVNINPASKFLKGKNYNNRYFEENGYWHKDETHLPNHISNQIKSILSNTQPGAHRSALDNYINEVKNPYVFKSTLYQLMDVIAWVKIYFDSNPQKRNWERV